MIEPIGTQVDDGDFSELAEGEATNLGAAADVASLASEEPQGAAAAAGEGDPPVQHLGDESPHRVSGSWNEDD
eukprot:2764310-Pyramimonas_sp.AAC.1